MNASITSEATTLLASDGQRRQIVRVAGDALLPVTEKLDLSHEGAQRVLYERAKELQDAMREAFLATVARLAAANPYTNERTTPTRKYMAYREPQPIEAQIAILREVWPQIDPGAWIAHLERSKRAKAEGYGVFLDWESLFACAYGEALECELFPALAARWTFVNHRKDALGPERIRPIARTTVMRAKINASQQGPVKVFPVQLGRHHAGESQRCARGGVDGSEFMLGALDAGTSILANPSRFVSNDDLGMDAPGDEYHYLGDGARWADGPSFWLNGDRLSFDANWSGLVSGEFGSASGFLPQ